MSTKRLPVTIQLTSGKDEDLKTSIKNLPPGQRNSGLKAVLRAGFSNGYSSPELPRLADESDEVNSLRAEIFALKKEMESMREDILWMKNALSDLPQYLAGIIADVARYGPDPHEVQDEPSVEAMPRLTASEIAERERKMKKSAQW